MKKMYLLLILPLLWVSCSKEDVTPEDDLYIFREIRYHVDEAKGDGIREISRELPLPWIYNRTMTVVTVMGGKDYAVEEYSRFSSDPYPARNLRMDETILIPIPETACLMNSGWDVLSRMDQKPLKLDGRYEYTYDRSGGSDVVALSPGFKLEREGSLLYTESTVSYTAVFAGEETGEILEITGTCTSTSLLRTHFKSKVSKIEE